LYGGWVLPNPVAWDHVHNLAIVRSVEHNLNMSWSEP